MLPGNWTNLKTSENPLCNVAVAKMEMLFLLRSIFDLPGVRIPVLLAAVLIIAFSCAVLPSLGHGQTETTISDISEASDQAVKLLKGGRYGEAVPFAKQALALTEKKFPAGHAEVMTALHTLAMCYKFNNQYVESERHFRRLFILAEKKHGPSHAETGYALLNIAESLAGQEKYAEAKTYFDRSVSILEAALGADNAEFGAALGSLGSYHAKQHRLDLAIPLKERSLAIQKKKTKPDARELATAYANLALLYSRVGRFDEAERNYNAAISEIENTLGVAHPLLGGVLDGLSLLHYERADYAKAAAACERALSIQEKAHGQKHLKLISPLQNLAHIYKALDRKTEAEALMRRSLAIIEQSPTTPQKQLTTALGNMGLFYLEEGRASEGEVFLKRALTTAELAFGLNAPEVAVPLNNLAGLYESGGRLTEALPLLQRSLEILEKSEGLKSPKVATVLNNIRRVHTWRGNADKAEPYAKRAVDIYRDFYGEKHAEFGVSLGLLGAIYSDLKRYDEAEPMLLQGLAVLETALPKDSSRLISPLRHIGDYYRKRERVTDAIGYYERSIEISKKRSGGGGDGVKRALNEMGLMYFGIKDWPKALSYYQESSDIVLKQDRKAYRAGTAAVGLRDFKEAMDGKWVYQKIVEAGYRVASSEPARAAELRSATFIAAQRGLISDAARALAQMSSRAAAADPKLAAITRERQDLASEWQRLDRQLIAARASEAESRDQASEAEISGRQSEIDGRLAAVDRKLSQDFPEFEALDGSQPSSIEEVQAWLREGEVFVFPYSTFEVDEAIEPATYVWAITKEEVKWERADIGVLGVAKLVSTLRCGVDFSAWEKPLCADDLGMTFTRDDYRAGKPLPFKLQQARELYRSVFGKVDSFIADKHLIVVPTFVMNRFPLHALVTAEGETEGPEALRKAAWLAKRNAITVLPAVSSLKSLRRNAKTSRAKGTYFGVGNPELDGPNDNYAALAQLARARQKCPDRRPQGAMALTKLDRRAAPLAATATADADASVKKMYSPLPETADELCEVAGQLNARPSDVLLAHAATKSAVKALSDSGELAKFRVVHFATHAALGGRFEKDTEPGLILTPSAELSDDGYLTASEISQLKLDADWVILSACNTAGSNTTYLESLTGLTQAFFYAGARSLLASNWEVESEATVKLVTHAVTEMTRDPTIGKAEAFRRSMVNLIEKGQMREAHPSVWAPFIVVGEGAAGR